MVAAETDGGEGREMRLEWQARTGSCRAKELFFKAGAIERLLIRGMCLTLYFWITFKKIFFQLQLAYNISFRYTM